MSTRNSPYCRHCQTNVDMGNVSALEYCSVSPFRTAHAVGGTKYLKSVCNKVL